MIAPVIGHASVGGVVAARRVLCRLLGCRPGAFRYAPLPRSVSQWPGRPIWFVDACRRCGTPLERPAVGAGGSR